MANGNEGTLNVILHGNIALHIRKNYIKGIVPDFGQLHCYRAGPWLAETTLWSGREYVLEGVTGGTAEFDMSANLFLDGAVENPSAARYASFIFPKPISICSTERVTLELGSGLLGADITQIAKPPSVSSISEVTLSTVQILTYEYADFERVRLGSHPWTPDVFTDFDAQSAFLNLHIFCEPDAVRPHDTVDDFSGSLKLFQKADGGRFELYPTLHKPSASQGTLPPGVLLEEVEGLIKRSVRLQNALLGLRTERKIDWQPLAEEEGEQQPVCGSPGGTYGGGD